MLVAVALTVATTIATAKFAPDYFDIGPMHAVTSDGRALLGMANDYSTEAIFSIARFDSRGALDKTFGTKGVVDISNGFDLVGFPKIMLQSSDRVLWAQGRGYKARLTSRFPQVVRMGTDGRPDPTFGVDGYYIGDVRAEWTTFYEDALVLPDDGIVLSGIETPRLYDPGNVVPYLIRLTADGHPVQGFGDADGRLYLPSLLGVGVKGWSFGAMTVVERAGRAHLLVSMGHNHASGRSTIVLGYLDAATGALDTTFGEAGVVTIDEDLERFKAVEFVVDQTNGIEIYGNHGAAWREHIAVIRVAPDGRTYEVEGIRNEPMMAHVVQVAIIGSKKIMLTKEKRDDGFNIFELVGRNPVRLKLVNIPGFTNRPLGDVGHFVVSDGRVTLSYMRGAQTTPVSLAEWGILGLDLSLQPDPSFGAGGVMKALRPIW